MTYKINFLLRTDKVNEHGERPIILTLSIANQMRKLNTRKSVLPELWDRSTKQVKYLNRRQAKELLPNVDFDQLPLLDNVKKMNSALSEIETKIDELIQLRELQKVPYSSESILAEYKNQHRTLAKKTEVTNLVFDYIDKYIEENTPSRAKGSLSVYKSLKTHLKSFQDEKKRKVKFADMDYDFFLAFQNFLFDHVTAQGKTLNNITVAKQLSTLKTFLGYAKKSKIAVNEGYRDFVIKRQKLEVIALHEDEFYKVYNLDLSTNPRLDRVRDVFCFSCMVGYRYSDLAQFRRHHLKNEDTIVLTSEKVKKLLTTPLNSIAKAILAKYKDDERPLPIISNQKYNNYLTEVFQMAELNEKVETVRFRGAEKVTTVKPKWDLLTSHSGRKSFATMLLAKGVETQLIMELGGWSDFRSFQRYIKINEDMMRDAVQKAWG